MTYKTKSGNYTAEILATIAASNNQPKVVLLTDSENGLQEVHCYTNDLCFFSDRSESGLDLEKVEV